MYTYGGYDHAPPHYFASRPHFTTASVFRSVRPSASTVTMYIPSLAYPPFRSRPSQRTRFAPAFIVWSATTSRMRRPEREYTRTVTGAARPRVKLMPTSRSAKDPVGENTRGVKARPAREPVLVETPESVKSAYRPGWAIVSSMRA